MPMEPSTRRRERLAFVGALFAGAALWVGAPAFGGSGDAGNGATPSSEVGSPFVADTTPSTPETTPSTPEGTTPDEQRGGNREDCPDKGGNRGDEAPADEAPGGTEAPAV